MEMKEKIYMRASLAAAVLSSFFAIAATPALAVEPIPCPNTAMREQQHSGYLPGCRAYEKVSPADKGNVDIPSASLVRSSADGDSVAYSAYGAFAGATSASSNNYLARRGATGWGTKSIDPAITVGAVLSNENTYAALDQNLDAGILRHFAPPSLVSGDDPQHWNIYLRDNRDDSYSLVTPPQQTETGAPPFVEDATPNLSHVALDTPNANVFVPGGPELAAYLWTKAGGLSLASIEPGTSTPFPTAGVGDASSKVNNRALSDDGSRLFFTAPTTGSEPTTGAQLYLRSGHGTADAETVDVSTPEAGVVDPNGTQTAKFLSASTDGSRALFSSAQRLTADATANSATGSADLYMFDADTGTLADLTTADPAGAGMIGLVGASADASVVYFVAGGALAGGAVAGEPNLYVWQADSGPQYLGTLSSEDELAWKDEGERARQAKVSTDGRQLAFVTKAPLDPSFDNVDPTTSSPHREVYLYSLGAAAPRCVSCVGSGPATADASLTTIDNGFFAASGIYPAFIRQNLSDDGGKLFFESGEALIGADTNGAIDVYEYDTSAATLALISGGQSRESSSFAGASPSGDDVFFITRQRLLPSDIDSLADLYDARVGGGIEEPAAAPPPCAGDACQSPAAASPPAAAIGTAGLSGPAGHPPRRSRPKKPCHSAPKAKSRRCAKTKRRHKSGHRRHRPMRGHNG
jgi:Tol biopolymer transport system component